MLDGFHSKVLSEPEVVLVLSKLFYENRAEVRDYARDIGYQDVVESLPTII